MIKLQVNNKLSLDIFKIKKKKKKKVFKKEKKRKENDIK